MDDMGELHDERDRPEPVPVPHRELSEEALRGVIESFVLREGTDYGERDVPHDAKIAQVLRQLERGEAKIMFDPVTASIDIVSTRGARRSSDAPESGS